MKYSFMTFACPEWNLSKIISAAKKYDYNGIEIRTDSKHAHGLETDTPKDIQKDACQRLKDAGLEIPCIATSLQFAISDKKARNDNIKKVETYADLAESLQCKTLRVFAGLDPATDVEEKITIAIDSLSSATEKLNNRNVTLSLETHDSLYLGKWISQVVKGVKSDKLQANWDIMHPFLHGESIEETYKHLSKIINHTHFHDGARRDATEESIYLAQIGAGELPHRKIMQLLKDNKHNVYLSGEWWPMYCGAPDVALPQFIDKLKLYESELN